MSGLRLGELCAGYGGLGMAVEEVFGASSAWFSEFDDAPSKILAHHWPDVPNYGDMTKIDWAAIEPADIISGGTPCQDLSAAGRRAGMTEGTRSNLWVQMREAVAIQRPQYVVWENVRGAYSAEASSDLEFCPGCMGDATNRGTVLRALGRVLGDLSDLGYDAEWRGLRAADVGSCHARYRVFVLAQNRDGGRSRRWTPDAGAGQKEWADTTSRRADQGTHAYRGWQAGGGATTPLMPTPTVGMTLGGSMARPGGRNGEPLLPGVATLLPTVAAHDSGNTPEQHLAKKPGRSQVTSLQVTVDHLLPTCKEPSVPDKISRTPVQKYEDLWYSLSDRSPYWATEEREGIPSVDYWPAIQRWEQALGRVSPPPSIPDGRGGKFRLNPALTEWMMGLPKGWVTDPAIGISRNEQLKACGNGVVPQQAMAALREMLAVFQTVEVAA